MKSKILTVIWNVIFHVVRWATLIIQGILILFSYMELFTYDKKDFWRLPGCDSWNYTSEEYYWVHLIISSIWSPIIFISFYFKLLLSGKKLQIYICT